MSGAARNHLTDLRGASRIAVDAIGGITALVEALHSAISKRPTQIAGPVVGGAVAGTTAAVYQGIRGVARAVGGGLDLALAAVAPALGELDSSRTREAVVAALNGVLGDYLADSGNPLAITMRLRRDGQPLELTRTALAAAGATGSKLLVLVHGLCMNDLRWQRNGHDHGIALARDLRYAPVYLHYNSGLHISTNGHAFTQLLEALVGAWPVPVEELAIVAHSMGGLVARSAHHYASAAGHAWPRALRKLVFLGTPHHGVALERIGHWLDGLWEMTPYTAPFAMLGRVRSAGITDLRHSFLLDADWQGRDRFAAGAAGRALSLPDQVGCFAIAAALGRDAGATRDGLVGDGLVSVPSALGRHPDPRRALAFPESHLWTAHATSHLELLSRPEVYEHLRAWLAD